MLNAYLTEARNKNQRVIKLICERKLKDAFSILKSSIIETGSWELQSAIEELETAYNFMLSYMREDIADPARMDMHKKLLRDALTMTDKINLNRISHAPYRTQYFKVQDKRKGEIHQQTLNELLMELEAYTENYAVSELLSTTQSGSASDDIRKQYEEAQIKLFELVWTTPYWTIEDEEAAKLLRNSMLVSSIDTCLFVSAVTLSLIENFDRSKLLFLFDAYNHSDNQVNQRALVGLVLAFQLYHNRLPFYPEIVARLSLLNETQRFALSLNRVQNQLLLSKETDKINKKMQEEIIPEMIKNASSHNLHINPEENDDDFNPDWSKNIDNPAFENMLREMSELQMEGADVYMSTFKHQKGYPFFRTINSWFYPFDKQHSVVANEFKGGTGSTVIDMVLDSAMFCDSDKYSLLFTLMQTPPAHREMMLGQLPDEQMEELKNSNKMESVNARSARQELVSNQYIHNLYRFFKLYRHSSEFLDVFEEPIHLNEYPVLKELMYKPELLHALANFHFRKEHYTEAARVYHALLSLEGDNVEVYQRIGYCHQKLKEYTQARDMFLQADVLKPDNVWTNRHLATCYRMMSEYDKALVYYRKVEQVQPQNYNLLYNIGSCLVELNCFDEALQHFFKLDFVEPDNLKTWRAVAWCAFMLKKHEQAQKYLDKILEEKPTAFDYLNAGHVAWCLGDIKSAVKFYGKSSDITADRSCFFDIFDKDKEHLVENGIDEYSISLMREII